MAALARLLTADRQFARNLVNRVWRTFFSRGLVEPEHGFDPKRLDPAAPPESPWTIQPSHLALLEHLADVLIAGRFYLKTLMCEIVSSRTYQLSASYDGAWSPGHERFFARHPVRRLSAEEIHDAVAVATGTQGTFPLRSTVGRVRFAMQLPDVVNSPVIREGVADTKMTNSLLKGIIYLSADNAMSDENCCEQGGRRLARVIRMRPRQARKGGIVSESNLPAELTRHGLESPPRMPRWNPVCGGGHPLQVDCVPCEGRRQRIPGARRPAWTVRAGLGSRRGIPDPARPSHRA